MKTLRNSFALFLVLLIFSRSKNSTDSHYGGTFRMNFTEDFRSLYPLSVLDDASINIGRQIYEGLVKFDPQTLQIVPALASGWEADTSFMKWIFHIRNNVYFHDDACFTNGKGRAMTVHDIEFCFRKMCVESPLNYAYPNFKGIIKGAAEYSQKKREHPDLDADLDGVKVLDDSTISVETTAPCHYLIQILATPGCWIYPNEALAKYGDDMRVHAVGTGPFCLEKLVEGEEMVLQRNPVYWKSDENGNQLPYLDNVRISFLKDKKSELNAFQNQDIDMLWNPSVDDLTSFMSSAVDSFTKPPQFLLSRCNALSLTYYGFNNSVPPFNNLYVRQAFCCAIDREKIVDDVYKGYVSPAENGFVPPGINGYTGQEKYYTYDPEKARALLKKAGYKNGKGFPEITLQVNAGSGNLNVDLATEVADMLKENLGVNINVSVLPFAQHLETVETGNVLFWRSGWVADWADPRSFLILAYGKNVPEDLHSRSSLNAARFVNKDFDAEFEMAETENNETDRLNDYHAAEKIAMDNAFVCPMYYYTNYLLLGAKVQKYYVNGLGLRDLSEVYLTK